MNIMDSPNLEFYLPKPKILFSKTHNIFLVKAEYYFMSLGQDCYAHKKTRENIIFNKTYLNILKWGLILKDLL